MKPRFLTGLLSLLMPAMVLAGEYDLTVDRVKIDTGDFVKEAWHTVLVKRKDQAVPVNGRHLIQVVGHVDPDVFTFLEAQHRSRRCAVVSNAFLHKIAG